MILGSECNLELPSPDLSHQCVVTSPDPSREKHFLSSSSSLLPHTLPMFADILPLSQRVDIILYSKVILCRMRQICLKLVFLNSLLGTKMRKNLNVTSEVGGSLG